MQIARLDNEVFFKKAFTDPVVFRAFVKDIVGIEVDPEVIETEKGFSPRMGNVAFKYDIFAEDRNKRVIIEIQKVDYDYNFDRFLHYHLQGITELQRSASDYSIDKTVYTIVVVTAPYKMDDKTGKPIQDEVLVSSLNPKNLKGIEKDIYGHELIFLNPNYRGADTPGNYRDWLDLIYESIHNPENPRINTNNSGISRAAAVVGFDNISPEEWETSKIDVARKKTLAIEKKIGREEREEEMIIGFIKLGVLTDEQIAKASEVAIEKVTEIRQKIENQ